MKLKPIEMYLQRAIEYKFTPADVSTKKGRQEAYRYLIANKLIPVNAKNLKKIPGIEIALWIEQLPQAIVQEVTAAAADHEKWEFDEQTDIDDEAEIGWKISEVYVKNGKVTAATILKSSRTVVTDRYTISNLEIPIKP